MIVWTKNNVKKSLNFNFVSFIFFVFGCFLYLIEFIADVVFGDKLIIKVCLICVRFPYGMCICVSLWILYIVTCRSPWRLRWRVSKHNVLTSLVFIAKYFSSFHLEEYYQFYYARGVCSRQMTRETSWRDIFVERLISEIMEISVIRELYGLCNGCWQTVTIY